MVSVRPISDSSQLEPGPTSFLQTNIYAIVSTENMCIYADIPHKAHVQPLPYQQPVNQLILLNIIMKSFTLYHM